MTRRRIIRDVPHWHPEHTRGGSRLDPAGCLAVLVLLALGWSGVALLAAHLLRTWAP